MVKGFAFFLSLLMALLSSCVRNDEWDNSLRLLKSRPIVFPVKRLQQKRCVQYESSDVPRNCRLVHYVDLDDCGDCQIAAVASMDDMSKSCKTRVLKDSLQIIYVLSVSSSKSRDL